ncbi:MAG: DCC1-like thiol-disulfide oxidoreductase family protein [Pseudomonadota bacterium]
MKISLDTLDAQTRDALQGRDLIVFDGVCVLCSGFFKFKLRHDRQKRFSFAMAQADLGQACYAALGMLLDDCESHLVIKDGWIHTDLDAFAAAMAGLGWPWKALSAMGWLPRVVKVPLYRVLARHRYRLFGRYETCIMPDEGVKARFLQRDAARAVLYKLG